MTRNVLLCCSLSLSAFACTAQTDDTGNDARESVLRQLEGLLDGRDVSPEAEDCVNDVIDACERDEWSEATCREAAGACLNEAGGPISGGGSVGGGGPIDEPGNEANPGGPDRDEEPVNEATPGADMPPANDGGRTELPVPTGDDVGAGALECGARVRECVAAGGGEACLREGDACIREWEDANHDEICAQKLATCRELLANGDFRTEADQAAFETSCDAIAAECA